MRDDEYKICRLNKELKKCGCSKRVCLHKKENKFIVFCLRCEKTTPLFEKPEEAVEKWNMEQYE
jgi:hypothetical protein